MDISGLGTATPGQKLPQIPTFNIPTFKPQDQNNAGSSQAPPSLSTGIPVIQNQQNTGQTSTFSIPEFGEASTGANTSNPDTPHSLSSPIPLSSAIVLEDMIIT